MRMLDFLHKAAAIKVFEFATSYGIRWHTAPTIRINGEDMPQQVVKSRFLKLNSSHIEYVLEAMNKNPSDIRNIRAYILTALYNASLTIDNYYSALVNHDFYGRDYNYDEDCL